MAGTEIRRWAWKEASENRKTLLWACVLSHLPRLIWIGVEWSLETQNMAAPLWGALLSDALGTMLELCLAFVTLELSRGVQEPRFGTPLKKGQRATTVTIAFFLFGLRQLEDLVEMVLMDAGGEVAGRLASLTVSLILGALLLPIKYLALLAPEKGFSVIIREGGRKGWTAFWPTQVFCFRLWVPVFGGLFFLGLFAMGEGGLMGLCLLLAGLVGMIVVLIPYIELAEAKYAREILGEGEGDKCTCT